MAPDKLAPLRRGCFMSCPVKKGRAQNGKDLACMRVRMGSRLFLSAKNEAYFKLFFKALNC